MKILKFLFIIALVLASTVRANAQAESKSTIAGFVAFSAGNFSISFPTASWFSSYGVEDYEFEDIYGSKNGLSFGGEAGIGLGDIGLFAVLKYKVWSKKGHPLEFGGISFNGDTEWTQDFAAIGARYYFVKQTQNSKIFLPFLGLGIARSTAKEKMEGVATYGNDSEYVNVSEDVDGTGVYFEGGANFYLSQSISLTGMLEYTSLNLGTSEYGSRVEIDGGGGLFLGIAINAFFGYPMKNITNNPAN